MNISDKTVFCKIASLGPDMKSKVTVEMNTGIYEISH